MVKMTVGIEGMMCGMCEAHMNDAIRNSFKVKSVHASRSDKKAVIIAEKEISKEELEKVIREAGYKMLQVETEPYEKKGLFGFLK
jgi:copper chaperone CopZ